MIWGCGPVHPADALFGWLNSKMTDDIRAHYFVAMGSALASASHLA